MKLSEIKVGQKAKVLSIKTTGALKKRLMDMGVLDGEIVIVEKIAPF